MCFFSDEDNHSSIISGIKATNCLKFIFKHNNLDHLEYLLKTCNKKDKIVICESIYSTDGSKVDLSKLSFLCRKYDCLLYVDEIHAIGVYGKRGSGLSDNYQCKDIDIVMGGFGKGFGTIGGYISGNKNLIDAIRCTSVGLIFSTSIPPLIAASTIDGINYLQTDNSYVERQKLIESTNYMKKILSCHNVKFIDKKDTKDNHIIDIPINNASKCNYIADILFNDYDHYVQPINYPTVKKNKEIFRITVNRYHTKEMMLSFSKSLSYIMSNN